MFGECTLTILFSRFQQLKDADRSWNLPVALLIVFEMLANLAQVLSMCLGMFFRFLSVSLAQRIIFSFENNPEQCRSSKADIRILHILIFPRFAVSSLVMDAPRTLGISLCLTPGVDASPSAIATFQDLYYRCNRDPYGRLTKVKDNISLINMLWICKKTPPWGTTPPD